MIEQLSVWPSFQHKPHLRGPLLVGEWSVEAEVRMTILTKPLGGQKVAPAVARGGGIVSFFVVHRVAVE